MRTKLGMANMEVVKARRKTESNVNIVNQRASTTKIEKSSRSNERIGYQEIPGLRHETKDVLKQLQTNIQVLEDLGGRLGFVMSEVRSVIRR